MPQWEHRVVRKSRDISEGSNLDLDFYTESVLDEYGDDGWEVVSVSSECRMLASESELRHRRQLLQMRVHATFKRQKEAVST